MDTDIDTENHLQETLDRITARAKATPGFADELEELAKAQRMVWLAELKALVRETLGKRFLAWNPALCSNPRGVRAGFDLCTGGHGIVVQGLIGRGKSTTAVHLLLGLALRDAVAMQHAGYSLPDVDRYAYITRSQDLFCAMNCKYGDARDRGDIVIAKARSARYLLIDDLGREDEDAYSFANFEALMDYRYAQERPVIIATNLAPADYAQATDTAPAGRKAHWAAVISRLQQTASWIVLTGPDLRTQEEV